MIGYKGEPPFINKNDLTTPFVNLLSKFFSKNFSIFLLERQTFLKNLDITRFLRTIFFCNNLVTK